MTNWRSGKRRARQCEDQCDSDWQGGAFWCCHGDYDNAIGPAVSDALRGSSQLGIQKEFSLRSNSEKAVSPGFRFQGQMGAQKNLKNFQFAKTSFPRVIDDAESFAAIRLRSHQWHFRESPQKLQISVFKLNIFSGNQRCCLFCWLQKTWFQSKLNGWPRSFLLFVFLKNQKRVLCLPFVVCWQHSQRG